MDELKQDATDVVIPCLIVSSLDYLSGEDGAHAIGPPLQERRGICRAAMGVY